MVVPIPGALPPNRQGRVDGDEEKEGPAEEHVQGRLGGNIRRHEAAPPLLGDEVEEVLGLLERVLGWPMLTARRRRRLPGPRL